MSDTDRNQWIADNIMGGERFSYYAGAWSSKMLHDGVYNYFKDGNAVIRAIEEMRDAGHDIVIRTSLAPEWIVTINDGAYACNESLPVAVFMAIGCEMGVIK
jgi:hypothetical protein